ncbi:Tetratricopeptide repeat protein [Roseimaritima ulvae]|uniref:Tetratricopeptide repeat protein n=2 Tax=Roseimaritima ulvae TaxID=980254 RepID=A0A5B9QKT5_9BACT|nr:Tetratricopeptide repeat protein [Roseimaritima ulvae]
MTSDAHRKPTTPKLGPLEGGPWRPVQPDELLRRDPPSEPAEAAPPAVNLQRQQELERYLQPRPADVDAYRELAEIYRQLDRPLDARRTLQKGLEIHPDEPKLLWQFEEACLAQSLHQLREVTALTKRLGTPEAQRELDRSRTDWACRRVDVCRARLKRDPQNMQLRVVLAEALRDMGLFEAAIEAAEVVAGHDALAPTAFLIRGQCYQALGESMKALPLFRAAALRRATPAPPRLRIVALRAAMELAEQQGLMLSLQRYERFLKIAEAELQTAASTAPSSSAPNVESSELSSEGSQA